eukprot:SAG22_NODE_53_length_24242_cov_158.884231_2_plen_167_part_00
MTAVRGGRGPSGAATDDPELGLVGIVSNPVAEGHPVGDGTPTEDSDGEELVVLPAQLEHVGRLLSTATGRPTLVCWYAGAVLVSAPLAFLLVIGNAISVPSTLGQAMSGDTQGAIVSGLQQCGQLAIGPAALHALFLVTRPQPHGQLIRLGGGTRVPRARLDALAR